MEEDRGSGWLTFSAIVLVFAGVMKIFDSIWAFRAHNIVRSLPKATLGSNLKNYGWYWLILGILLIIAGFGVLARSQIARWFAIVVVAVAGIASMAWMPYYPIWSLTYVAIAILVIYGLAAHGGLEIPGTTPSPTQ